MNWNVYDKEQLDVYIGNLENKMQELEIKLVQKEQNMTLPPFQFRLIHPWIHKYFTDEDEMYHYFEVEPYRA